MDGKQNQNEVFLHNEMLGSHHNAALFKQYLNNKVTQYLQNMTCVFKKKNPNKSKEQ